MTTLPGSHHFGSDFIVALSSNPDPHVPDPNVVWALTADLSDTIPVDDRAMYLAKSSDGGVTWQQLARIDARYFDAKLGEGLRNGLAVAADGKELIFTTQRGAFRVTPHPGADAEIVEIPGPRVPRPRLRLNRPKHSGDPIMAGVVQLTPDGSHMLIGFGYFDRRPQLLWYRRAPDGSWVEDGPLPKLPTDLDVLSLAFDNPGGAPTAVYLGSGDQAYRLDLASAKWSRVAGVGPDSAIHSMSTVGGLHLAACWGVYNPLSAVAVQRVTDARFLLHRNLDEVGPNLRAYGVEVDPSRPNRVLVTAITGAYKSDDSGKTWRRLNDIPDGEYRSAHFNADGSVIVSGLPGTFVANPFSSACTPGLHSRER